MSASLDSLDIRISASATDAVRAIESLEDALVKLGQSLAPAAMGMQKISIAFDQIAAHKTDIEQLSKTVDVLSKSWSGLTNATTKTGVNMDNFSAKARTMADTLAKEWGIKSKAGVAELTNAINTMYNSVGDTVSIGKALGKIEDLIKEHSRFKIVANENAQALRAFVSQSSIQLDSIIKKSNDYKKIWGTLGGNISPNGMLPSELVASFNQSGGGALDITGLKTEEDYLNAIILTLQSAKDQTLTYADVTKNASTYSTLFGDRVTQLNETLNQLAFTVGTSANTAFSELASAYAQINAVSPQAAKEFMQLDMAVESLTDNPDPLRGLVDGLTELSTIKLDSSLQNLTFVKDAASKFSGKNIGVAGENIRNVAEALRDFPTPDISALPMFTDSLYRLGLAKVGHAFENLINAKVALEGFKGLTIDPSITASIQQLGDGLYKFGLAKMDKAVKNIPALSSALKQLISSLSSMPQVSENTIRLVDALGRMNINGSALNRTMNGTNGHMKRFTGHAFNAKKASTSLAAAFGKLYANFFLVFRLFNRFKKDIDLASQLTETQNVVDVTFGNMTEKMNDFAKSSIETLGMSELTAKKIGSRYQAMGSAMGISKTMVQSTNDFVQTATKGYADVADSVADVSINLTRLAGDMASFYNQDYADVAEDLEAVYTGMARPLRKYGVDLSVASLKEFALKNGMNANIKTMTQAEKTMLRYQYVLAATTAAHGDFIRTQNTWANQTRIATEKLNQLRIVLGKIAIYTFKPLVQAFNKAMDSIIKNAEGLLNALGKIFGWQIEWSDAGIIGDESDDADELAENMGDAADNAKKFKNFLLGIDELNVLPDKNDTDKGKGGGVGGIGGIGDDLGDIKIKPVEKGFESLYDTLYKLGKKIAEVQKNFLKGIDWDKIYRKAQNFGKGFASFLNGYISDIELFYHKGRFLANAINTVAHAINSFFKEFDGTQFGRSLGMELNGFTRNLDWGVIKSAAYEFAHDIAGTTNGFFSGVNWKDLGKTFIEGINTAVLFASTIVNEINWGVIGNAIGESLNGIFENWDEEEAARMLKGAIKGVLDLANNFLTKTDFELLGSKLGHFFAELDLSQFAQPLANLILNLFKAAFDVLGTMALESPLEAALLTAFAGAKFLKLGSLIGTSITTALKSVLVTEVKTVATDTAVKEAAVSAGAGLGTAIAASVVTAIGGYEIGKKIGKDFFETDDMWYDSKQTNVGKELLKNFKEIPAGLSEMASFLKTSFYDSAEAYESFGNRIRDNAEAILGDLDSTWGEIKDKLRMGELEISDADFATLEAMLKQSGAAMSQIVPLINSLKDAQDEYVEGFSKFLETEGKGYTTREEAYEQYKKIVPVVDEYIKSHQRERLALQSGASTYQEVYDRITNITSSSAKSVVDNVKGMTDALTNHNRKLDGSSKSLNEFEKAASNGGRNLKIPMQAMTDLKDKSTLAISGLVDVSGKLEELGKSGDGVKEISTNFTNLKTNLGTFVTALAPVKTGFAEFTFQTQTEMMKTTQIFGQSFSGIMKYGNQTIAWLKSSFIPYFSGAYWNSITASIPNAFGNAFKQAINIMMNLWKQFSTWANDNMKMNVKLNGKEQTGLRVDIPQYSTGGFPAEDGLFAANHGELVGQFSNGRTAVANNEQIIEGIRQGVYEAVSSAMVNGGNVNVTLNGDAARFFTVMVEENENAIRRTGASPIRV